MTTLTISPGESHPLGADVREGGVNFAVFSQHATGVELLLFRTPSDLEPFDVIPMERTFHFWHIFVADLPEGAGYAYRVDGAYDPSSGHRFNPRRVLIDPYAKANDNTHWVRGMACDHFGDDIVVEQDNLSTSMRSVVVDHRGFDWRGDQPLERPMADSVIYEMHVRGFTQNPNSGVKARGTFAGIIDKIPYLKALGVTAIELLPVFEFDETDVVRNHEGQDLVNYWGYSTMSFFAPHRAFSNAATARDRIDEFRTMVRELHAAGIEVILDVVFNHTDEGQHQGPTFSFKGFDNPTYYHLTRGDRQYYMDYTGTGNTYNCNHPIVSKLIVDSLEYWVQEMHVDGFRFDEGTVLVRGQDGSPDQYANVIWDIELSHVLEDTKLIAEAWDAAGEYEIGRFPGFRWAEWNGKFRDDVRSFVRGDAGFAGAVAARMTGSADLYQASGHAPISSINFVVCHDGFTLNDLVSYNEKHNWANGEGNRDGINDNISWNCGTEGETDDPGIEALRERQIRNFTAIQMLSQGVPMIVAGDEVRRTQQGNNNAYCQDTELAWFDWDRTERFPDMLEFFCRMIAFRRSNAALRRDDWFDGSYNERGTLDITWHGTQLDQPDWSDSARTIAYTLAGLHGEPDLHIMINMYWDTLEFQLPDRDWRIAINTDHSGADAIPDPGTGPRVSNSFWVAGRSVVVLEAK